MGLLKSGNSENEYHPPFLSEYAAVDPMGIMDIETSVSRDGLCHWMDL